MGIKINKVYVVKYYFAVWNLHFQNELYDAEGVHFNLGNAIIIQLLCAAEEAESAGKIT